MYRSILLVTLALLVIAVPAYAAPREEATAFQTTFALSPLTVTIPSVVEVDLSQYTFKSTEFIVYEVGSGDWVTPQYRHQSAVQPKVPVVTDLATGNSLPALTDRNQTTSYTFGVNDNQITSTTLTIVYNQPITTGQLRFDLSTNVQLPRTVMVSVENNGREQVALATTGVTGKTISFPKLTGTTWKVTFNHDQPLRINELIFVDDAAVQLINKSLRFLAQPNQSYVVYANPDRPNTIQGRESGNVWGNGVVPVLAQVVEISDNPFYIENDYDGDGIPDTSDNCRDIQNPTQTDTNANKIGDDCEDFDQDNVMNYTDNCPDIPNWYQEDKDADGAGDACDDDESRLTEKYAWLPWVALGAALLTIIGMFVIVARRPLPSESETPTEDTHTSA